VLPKERVVRVTGAQLQEDGVKGLEKILEGFDQAGSKDLEVGDTVEAKRNGEWGNFGRIVHHDTSRDARPQFKNTYDVHFGKYVKFQLANGTTVTRRDHNFDIGVRRKDLRAQDEQGGVLIIDDAHQLDPGTEKAARQLLYFLADEMDERGGKLAVVMCGYEKAVTETILGFNQGALSSRFRRRYALPDFSDEELIELLHAQLERAKPRYHVSDDKYVRIAARRLGKGRGALGFGNARAVEVALDVASERQTARVMAERKAGGAPDIFEFARADLLGEPPRLLDASTSQPLRELRDMEGLQTVKASVDGLLKLAESNAQREELELPLAEVSLNRVFLGNPGTGKTTVARIYGRILRELGLLTKGDVVLATPADLLGSALGQSEEKTNALLDKSEGCVLVIDEAYGLDPMGGGSFSAPGGGGVGGDPFKTAVIDTLVSRVQGDAGADRCVILLGYRKEMERFIRKGNPGLARRFQLENAFEFDDYDDQALLRILLRNVAKRGKRVSFDTAKQVVRRDLAKARMRPNFGNAGAVDNAVSAAVVAAEARLEALPAAERATQTALEIEDFLDEKPHMADPSLVFEGLIGCENIKTRLAEYQAVIEAASKAGRDPVDDLALTFCFQGSPGTGKTTLARRMGMLFEALGVLPSADVVQVSASEFSTGFVGQTAAKTRDIFDSARGAVLFIDEAYRLYDPAGRSYMQEAVDEIVTLLTEEPYRGKMVVIFAGYAGQMEAMLDRVNPGLKSRVSDVIDFPDFDAAAAAEIAEAMLARKRLRVPRSLAPDAARLVGAPQWANGRDVETWARRIAVECATRQTDVVGDDALAAATAFVLAQKRPSSDAAAAAARAPPAALADFLTDDQAFAPPAVDVSFKTVADAARAPGDDDEPAPGAGELDGALEDACAALGYAQDAARRAQLADLLKQAAGGGPLPGDILDHVVATRGGERAAVEAALRPQAALVRSGLEAQVAIDVRRRASAATEEELDDAEDPDELGEAAIVQRLREMGPCPMGFAWHRQGGGWRCAGGSHFVHDDDPLLQG
jgi:SpoVK/Ycf46/Vps4 family AAA+-type ATPase